MKKNLSIYFVFLLAVLSIVSCGMSDEEEYEPSPYAYVKSFSLGSIRSSYPAFTSEGKDTTVVKTVSMASFMFTIDQLAGSIYNCDSLPFATDVTKVTVNMSCEGVASIYVDSTDTYEGLSASDSIDFTHPRKVRIFSEGGEYYKDYTISINVHQLEPDMMVWKSTSAVEGLVPVRALEFNSTMYLFGNNVEGMAVVARTSIEGEPHWSVDAVSGLPSGIDFSTIHLFRELFYAVAEGCVYSSPNALDWEPVTGVTDAVAIVGVSDYDGKLWVAGKQELYCSTDGIVFDVAGALPENFPLYGVSTISYPLSHNNGIIRYVLVGYTSETEDTGVFVWSKLSNEDEWTCYNNVGNEFLCPALKGLAVVHYNGLLYALGGAGIVRGENVKAFESFFVSMDNGIVWKENSSFYQRLPKELEGSEAPFAVAVDSKNFMWIINSGTNGGVWKGIINNLGFQK